MKKQIEFSLTKDLYEKVAMAAQNADESIEQTMQKIIETGIGLSYIPASELDKKIIGLLSTRTTNVLWKNGIETVRELLSLRKNSLRNFHGVGNTGLLEIEQFFIKMNVKF